MAWSESFPGIPQATATPPQPCPLSSWQLKAYEDWLSATDERPCWSLAQFAPSAN